MDSLYATRNAVAVACLSCRRPIDLWCEHGLEISRSGISKRPESTRRMCPECLLLTYPPEQRSTLGLAYEAQRDLVREAGIPSSVTAYGLSNTGTPGTWSDGYLVIGLAAQVHGWDYAAVPRQPHITIMPDDPCESPLSFVFFAATIRHFNVKLSYLKAIWPFHDLSLPERFEVVNGLDEEVSLSDLDKLMRGRRFLRETLHNKRRPLGTGNYAFGEEDLFLENVEQILSHHERQGIRITNMLMLADKLGVGKTQLCDLFNRAPEARDRFHRHKRKPPRA